MDYAAEQAMEIEALQAILMDDLTEYLEKRPMNWPAEGTIWRVVLSPSEDFKPEEEDDSELLGEFLFLHTPHYPEEPPLFKIRDIRGLQDYHITAMTEAVNKTIQDSLGMAMIFQCVSDAKEWLRTKAEEAKPVDAEYLRKKQEEEEQERRAAARAAGTPVNPDTFRAWREKFTAEMALERAKIIDHKAVEEKAKKLTGRQWFERERPQADHVLGENPPEDEEEEDMEFGEDEEDFDYEDEGDEDFLDEYDLGEEDGEEEEDEDEDDQ